MAVAGSSTVSRRTVYRFSTPALVVAASLLAILACIAVAPGRCAAGDDDDGWTTGHPDSQNMDPDEIPFPDAKPRAHDEIDYPDAQPRAHDEIPKHSDDIPYPDARPRAHDEIDYPDAKPRAHDEIPFPDAKPREHDLP